MPAHLQCSDIYNVTTLFLQPQEWGFTISLEDAFDWLWQAHAHETGHRKGKGLYFYISDNKGYPMNITCDLCNFMAMCCWKCYHAHGREWEKNVGEMALGLGKTHQLTQTQLS